MHGWWRDLLKEVGGRQGGCFFLSSSGTMMQEKHTAQALCHLLSMVNSALGQLVVMRIFLFISLEIELHPLNFKGIIPCIFSHLKPVLSPPSQER